MKTLIRFTLGALASVTVLTALDSALMAQGTLNVDNRLGQVLDAPIYDTDCQTRLAGDAYLVQAYVGLTTDAMQATGPAFPFGTGRAAGYIQPIPFSDTVVSVPFPTFGPVYAQLRAWEAAAGPTYEQAAVAGGKYGFSNFVLFNPGVPPSPAANLEGLQSFCLVPEPSPLVLAAGALLVLGTFSLIRTKWRVGRLEREHT